MKGMVKVAADGKGPPLPKWIEELLEKGAGATHKQPRGLKPLPRRRGHGTPDGRDCQDKA